VPEIDRQLRITLEGGARVPVSVVGEKLVAAQRMLFSVATALIGGGRRGQWRGDVLDACTLGFVQSRAGSLELVAELPDPEQLSLHEDRDLGVRALAEMGNTLKSLQARDSKDLQRRFGDFGQRARVVKSALPLLPDPESEFSVSISAGLVSAHLDADVRPFAARLASEDGQIYPDEEVRVLTGQLYRVEVATGERHIGLLHRHRKIRCFYGPSFEDVIRDLIPGSIVEVEGRATLNAAGEVEEVEEVIDARTVEPKSLQWSRLSYSGRRFVLRRPIVVEVEFNDDAWTHRFEPLSILGFGETRGESSEAFRMDFAACWDAIAHERDEALTADARALKVGLRELVYEVQAE